MKRPTLAFFGAEELSPTDAGGDGTNDGGKDGDGVGSNGSDDGDEGGTDKTDQSPAELKAQVTELKKRMASADRARSVAEAKVKEYDDKDKSELDLAKQEAADAVSKAEATETALRQARIHNSFLASNEFTWHDPMTALALADLSAVEIGADGAVTGLDASLKKLAKDKPFLLKTVEKKPVPSGDDKDGRGGTGADKATEAVLRKKYRIPR